MVMLVPRSIFEGGLCRVLVGRCVSERESVCIERSVRGFHDQSASGSGLVEQAVDPPFDLVADAIDLSN